MGSLPTDPFFRRDDQNSKMETLFQKLREEFHSIVYKNLLLSNLTPDKMILEEEDVLAILKVSKRKFGYLREQKQINYSQPTPAGKIYCTFQDILDYVNQGRVKSISSKRRI